MLLFYCLNIGLLAFITGLAIWTSMRLMRIEKSLLEIYKEKNLHESHVKNFLERASSLERIEMQNVKIQLELEKIGSSINTCTGKSLDNLRDAFKIPSKTKKE